MGSVGCRTVPSAELDLWSHEGPSLSSRLGQAGHRYARCMEEVVFRAAGIRTQI